MYNQFKIPYFQCEINIIIDKHQFCQLLFDILFLQFEMNSKNKETLAIPFISYQQGSGFALSKQAQEFLLSLPENRKLSVVSIVGKYRTGKSFFVNRVLLDQKKSGFQVGPTINPCTKGLWLWKKTVQSPTDKDMDVIIIDTQGFGGMDQNANHDSRIFLFSLLLSSFFIYNSVGSIDENALNTLNLIINLAKDIQTKSNNNNEDSSHFPSFLWIVRDFTLKMVGKNGDDINSKEYLQSALQLLPGTSPAVQSKNKIRRMLKHFFQNRDCQSMVRPVERQKDLQRLDQIDNSQLRPQFVTQVVSIRQKIYKTAKAKKLNGKQLNGHLLVALCKGYMEAINKGMVPNVQSAWYYVCRSEGRKAIQTAIKFLDQKLEQKMNIPLSAADLQQLKKQLSIEVREQFKKKSMGSQQMQPELQQKLEIKIQQGLKQLQSRNGEIWARQFKIKSQQISEVMRDKIFRDQFSNFVQFQEDFEKLKQEYDQITKDGNQDDKWKYFNEITHDIYKLAGQSLTSKYSKTLETEKKVLEQKLLIQSEQLSEKTNKEKSQKRAFKQKIQQLQIVKTRLQASQQTSQVRLNQYKSQYQKLQEKNNKLQLQNEQYQIEIQKLKSKEHKNNQSTEQEIQTMRNEISCLKNSLQKQKVLFEMQKKYTNEQLERYKEKSQKLEGENKKLRTNCARLSGESEQIGQKYEECEIKCRGLEGQLNNNERKLERLMQENAKKSQIAGEHNGWMLEKAYLENQLSYLKNTLNENKRLHDALLVALQKSIAESEGNCNHQLIEANNNMAVSLERAQQRCQVLEQKYEKVKTLKKLFQNCSAIQCSHCNKWVQSVSFSAHIQQCGQNMGSLREKTLPDLINKENLHINVSQNISRQNDSATGPKKPHFEYIIQVITDDTKWKVSRQYRQFTQLSQSLIKKFPSLKFPDSFTCLAESKLLISKQSSKKNTVAQQRRKNLQFCLRDLAKVEQIRSCGIYRSFLGIQ